MLFVCVAKKLSILLTVEEIELEAEAEFGHYQFTFLELSNIISHSLTTNEDTFIITPKYPKNPYTNKIFTVGQLIYIYNNMQYYIKMIKILISTTSPSPVKVLSFIILNFCFQVF